LEQRRRCWSGESAARAEKQTLERKISSWSGESAAGEEKQTLERKIRCWSGKSVLERKSRCGGREADAGVENQFSRAENRLLEQRNRRWSVD
jgi:hypothetical protein